MRSAKKYLVGLSSAALVLGTLATGLPANAASAGSPLFSDIAGNSDAGAITWLATIGAVNGVGNGLFDPSAPVTREQMAKMVVNMIGKGAVAQALANTPSSFTDAATIEPDLLGYVNVAADMGIVNGYPDGSFRPTQPVTDAEAAAMILRAIGDNQNGIITGTWPGNYVSAAFGGNSTAALSSDGVNLASGVTFVANLPASRGDVAQMLYNAALFIPVYTTSTSSNGLVSFSKGNPLYVGESVNGNEAVQGVVGGVSTSAITVGGTSYNWASSYQLVGVTTLSSLIGQTVDVNVNSSGDVDYLALAPGGAVTSTTATLADGNTAVPSGYFQVNSNYPFLLTNSYTCSASNAGGNINPSAACNGTYSLLLGGTSPKTVPLLTYDSAGGSSGTTYEVNPSSDGTDLGILPATDGVMNLTQDDTVSYATNSSGDITSVQETNVNDQIGVVNDTWCASGCDNGINAAATPQIRISINGTDYTVNVQSYTDLTLNGATATVSKSLDNDIAYVATVAGWGQYNNQANPGTGDNNATSIALYNNQVTGTVTAVNTSTNAPNFSSTNTQGIVSFTLSLSNGSSETYTADGNFNANGISLTYGDGVTVALDSAGEAAYLISTTASTSVSVALVEYTGTQVTSSGTSYTLIVNDSNGSGQTLQLGASAPMSSVYKSTYWGSDTNILDGAAATTGTNPRPGTANSCTTWEGAAPFQCTTAPNGNNGLILFETSSSGMAVGPNPTSSGSGGQPQNMVLDSVQTLFPLAPAGDYLQVVSSSGSGAVLGLYNTSGDLDYANSNNNPFFSVVNGGSFDEGNNPATWIGSFSGLDTGEGVGSVSVWQGEANNVPYYAIVSIQ